MSFPQLHPYLYLSKLIGGATRFSITHHWLVIVASPCSSSYGVLVCEGVLFKSELEIWGCGVKVGDAGWAVPAPPDLDLPRCEPYFGLRPFYFYLAQSSKLVIWHFHVLSQ